MAMPVIRLALAFIGLSAVAAWPPGANATRPVLSVSAQLIATNASLAEVLGGPPPLLVIPKKHDLTLIKVREGLALNLSCHFDQNQVLAGTDDLYQYDLNWYLPGFLSGGLEPQKSPFLFSVVLRDLRMTDSGLYKCSGRRRDWPVAENVVYHLEDSPPDAEDEDAQRIFVHSVVLKILSADTTCADSFNCHNGICILQAYVCDGVPDCPDASDESIEQCGLDPCDAKLRCENQRCMDPGLCCNPDLDEACAYLHPCCQALVDSNRHFYQMGIKKRNQDMNMVHSTVYSIVACILAFFALVFLVTVVICRIHVRRCRHLFHLASGTYSARQPLSLYDLEVLMHLRRNNHNPYIGIVYNINNGVQMMGGNRNVTPPPPYHPDPQNDPPPPYDGLGGGAQGDFREEEIDLLNDVEDNNNGDINGNSDMVNQNIVQEQQQQQILEQANPAQPVSGDPALGNEGEENAGVP